VGFTGAITVTLDGGALKVADAGYDGSTPKNVILNVPSAADLKLKNSGLISPIAVPAFNIGLTTSRT
jgi:hypothetical protein